MTTLAVAIERWPLAQAFTIARGSKTEAAVVVVTLNRNGVAGRGECVPYARYGESVEGVVAAIEDMRAFLDGGGERTALQDLMPPGAARNALDCALWDLEAKSAGMPLWQLAGIEKPVEVVTAYTLSLGAPEAMEAAAALNAGRPLLKVKLGTPDDAERIARVRRGAPAARIIVDANEGWRADTLSANLAACAAAGVEFIEQPLPAGDDAALDGIDRVVALCADESLHDRASLEQLSRRYDLVNIKLDKTGGLTEALALAAEARRRGLGIMVGCMVGTSLAMAPALMLGPHARVIDLDGPLLLARDREPGLHYRGSVVEPPQPALWG